MTARDSGDVPLRSVEARLLRAALRDDERERDRIIAELDGGWPVGILTAAFVLAARRRFDDRWDRRVVLAFARRFVAQAPGGAGFAVRDAELLLRGVTGDPHLIAATAEVKDLSELYYALLLALADDLGLDDAAVDKLLAKAVRETAAAMQREEPPEETRVDPAVLRRYRRIHRRYLTDQEMVQSVRPAPREPSPLSFQPSGGHREPVTRAGRHLRSVLLGAGGPADDIPDMDLLRIARATLVEALVRYLPPNPEVSEIAALVRAASEAHPNQFHPMKAEYMVRLMMGEEGVPRDGINQGDVYLICGLLLQVIFVASHRDDAALCMMIVAAEEILAEMGRDLVV